MEAISILVFLSVIIAIISEKVHRTVAAMAGAVVLVITHCLTVDKAISHIDFNTIGVLIGMMAFVAVVKNCGLFEYVAIKAAKIAKGDPWKIMVAFIIITAVLSSFLDNVTTVLLIGPMTITLCKMLNINPVPLLISQIMAADIGGTATMIGDPSNIMIGSASHRSFLQFISNTGLVAVIVLVVLVIVMNFLYRKKLNADEESILKIMNLDESKAITDRSLMRKSLVVMAFVVVGFIVHDFIGIDSCIVALSAGVIMIIIGKQNAEEIIGEIEWPTLLFFAGLFIIVGGMEETGVIDSLARFVLDITQGNEIATMLIILWSAAILSSFLDNVPFVATLIPLVTTMGKSGLNVEPLWWAISLGACLGGNGTLIGASANVVLSGISNRYGYPITFKHYMKIGFPFMILSICIASGFLLIKYGL